MTNSPDISVALDGTVLKVTNKNPELLAIFMASYARSAFESEKGKQDQTKCNIAGLKSVMTFYKANIEKGLKKDKSIVKLMESNDKGELEKWVKENSGSK